MSKFTADEVDLIIEKLCVCREQLEDSEKNRKEADVIIDKLDAKLHSYKLKIEEQEKTIQELKEKIQSQEK